MPLTRSGRIVDYRATVREIARRTGHASRQQELSDSKRAEATRLYDDGLALAQAAAASHKLCG